MNALKKLVVTSALALTFGASAAYAANMIAPANLKASANSVTATVSADKAGYLVVHESDENGTMAGTVLGHAAIKAGENKDVKISLEKKLPAGTKLIVMLHEESNGDTVYDPEDKPVTAGRGPVQQIVTVQ